MVEVFELEEQLASKLEVYQETRREFYEAKERVRNLGNFLFGLVGELGMLRLQIRNRAYDEQLEVFDKDEYFEGGGQNQWI